ncbi:hypothetical protein ABEB36_003441 [Hypothenemus hampei]|uniref:HORMA domain-containing protein n=1 Tax=Hypothenemus hampei TaxID=57062 RepID=A0ABD1FBS6_HYPHA
MSSDEIKAEVVDIILEFLEVTIHNILYVRKLYPDVIYTLKKKYGVSVYQLIHPDLVKYIEECLKAVAFNIRNRQLKKLFICFEEDDTIIDTFVIDILSITQLSNRNQYLVDFENNLRDFMLKLHSNRYYFKEIKSGEARFSIHLQTTTLSHLEFNKIPQYESFPWILDNQLKDHLDLSIDTSMSIVPIHKIEADFLKLQIYVEK